MASLTPSSPSEIRAQQKANDRVARRLLDYLQASHTLAIPRKAWVSGKAFCVWPIPMKTVRAHVYGGWIPKAFPATVEVANIQCDIAGSRFVASLIYQIQREFPGAQVRISQILNTGLYNYLVRLYPSAVEVRDLGGTPTLTILPSSFPKK